MLNRAKRLGLPVGATAIAATTTTPATAGTEDALKKRTERFGAVSDESKKQARMQRFGQVTSSPASTAVSAIAKDEALQKRAQRFGLPIGGVTNTADDAAKKQARAQRFGPLASDSVAVKRPAGASAEELASLEKRAKRFGVTSAN
uniref:THO1-MOS11 C-terminal domain-containing protein n=1 Tax=Ditylenchus dipsaci TaxID=166011 RepID=A0A915DDL8_9BILA